MVRKLLNKIALYISFACCYTSYGMEQNDTPNTGSKSKEVKFDSAAKADDQNISISNFFQDFAKPSLDAVTLTEINDNEETKAVFEGIFEFKLKDSSGRISCPVKPIAFDTLEEAVSTFSELFYGKLIRINVTTCPKTVHIGKTTTDGHKRHFFDILIQLNDDVYEDVLIASFIEKDDGFCIDYVRNITNSLESSQMPSPDIPEIPMPPSLDIPEIPMPPSLDIPEIPIQEDIVPESAAREESAAVTPRDIELPIVDEVVPEVTIGKTHVMIPEDESNLPLIPDNNALSNNLGIVHKRPTQDVILSDPDEETDIPEDEQEDEELKQENLRTRTRRAVNNLHFGELPIRR